MPNYELQSKLEYPTSLKIYAGLVKEPVTSKNAKHIRALQDKNVHNLMRIAYDIPFYRERFERTNTTPDDYHRAEDLYKFPLLTKDDLRTWMDEELERDPEKYAHWHIYPTSGSTGQPLRVLRSPHEAAFGVANWLRILTLIGFDPFRGKTMSRPNSLHTKTKPVMKDYESPLQRLGFLRRRFMSDTIKNRVDTQVLVDEINAYEPDLLYNHKNVLVRIARYVKDNDLYVWKPKFYCPVSEMLDEPSSKLLQEVFGPGLFDSYGLAETDSCVIRRPGEKVFQVSSDTYVVNIYNEDLTGPSDNGMAIITPLAKTDLPIINYTTLDYMESYMEYDLRFVTRIQGRMNDVIHHVDGGITEWANIQVVMNFMSEVVAYRIIQEELDSIHFLLVRHPDVPEEDQPKIEASMFEWLGKILNDENMHMTAEWVDDIPADPTGKLRVIVSKLDK